MRRRDLWLSCFFVVIVAGLLSGCGRGPESASEWTVDEGALTLKQDLLVAETESFYFGSVSDVAVASDGRMFVLDWEDRHIKVLNSEGTLLDSLGGEGEGPGEFQRPRQMVVGRGDSLFVLDDRSRRISVFASSGEFVRRVQLETEGAVIEALMVPDEASGFLLAFTSLSPAGSSEDGAFTVRRIGPTGSPGDTVFIGEPRKTVSFERGDMSVYYGLPYGREPRVALGPSDHLYYGRTDSVHIISYSVGGARIDTLAIPHDPIPISDEERAERVEGRSSGVRAKILEAMPETKPAFNDFLVDDSGRFWFDRPTAHRDTTEWWVADPDEKHVATTRLTDDVRILVVRDGYAYGRTTAENGAPALVRYRVRVRD